MSTCDIRHGQLVTAIRGDTEDTRNLLLEVATQCTAGEWAELRERCCDTTRGHLTESEHNGLLEAVDQLLTSVFRPEDLPRPTVYVRDNDRRQFVADLFRGWSVPLQLSRDTSLGGSK